MLSTTTLLLVSPTEPEICSGTGGFHAQWFCDDVPDNNSCRYLPIRVVAALEVSSFAEHSRHTCDNGVVLTENIADDVIKQGCSVNSENGNRNT